MGEEVRYNVYENTITHALKNCKEQAQSKKAAEWQAYLEARSF